VVLSRKKGVTLRWVKMRGPKRKYKIGVVKRGGRKGIGELGTKREKKDTEVVRKETSTLEKGS